jgi:Sad1 / UNC-like C-terminal
MRSGILAPIREVIFGPAYQALNLIKESPPMGYWSFRGPLGSVGIRFSRRVNIARFSIKSPRVFDVSCSAPKRLEIWGLLDQDTPHNVLLRDSKRFKSTYNIEFMPSILLAEFSFGLKPFLSKESFPNDPRLREWGVEFNTVLLIIHSHSNQSHTCIHRFHAYGK